MLSRVLQFRVTMKGIEPEIWRRILVPESYSFWDLHVAIQDAMGWKDHHLHAFRISKKHARTVVEIGIPTEEDPDDVLAGWQVPIVDYLREVGVEFDYEYDFGDGWEHHIQFEGILARERGAKYPRCTDGARACPPEDCGGIPRYQEILAILSDPRHDEYADTIIWFRNGYDPELFDPKAVEFDDPRTRWEERFSMTGSA